MTTFVPRVRSREIRRGMHASHLSWRSMLALLLVQFLLSSCAAAQVPVGIGRSDKMSGSDATLFSTIIEAVIRHTRDDRVRVDPRPLRSDPSIGPFVRPEQFAPVDSAVLRGRAAELVRLGIGQFRLGENDRCGSGPGGTPPVIEPGDSTTLREWLSQATLPTCVLTSQARPGGVHYPPANIDRRNSAHPDQWVVRVVTIGRGQATDVFDVVVRPAADQKWAVVEFVRVETLRS